MSVDIAFASNDLEECGRETAKAIRRWGAVVGDRYVQRLVLVAGAPDFDALHTIRSLRLHKLTGNRKDVYAIVLQGRWRLLLSKVGERQVLVLEVSNHYGD